MWESFWPNKIYSLLGIELSTFWFSDFFFFFFFGFLFFFGKLTSCAQKELTFDSSSLTLLSFRKTKGLTVMTDLGGVNFEVIRVYRMLDPKPKELLNPSRRFVREGPMLQWEAGKHKPKYFFLFNDCMLITKKEGQKRYWLKVFVSLNPGIKVADVPNSSYRIPHVEFRMFAPKKSFIFFASSPQVFFLFRFRHKNGEFFSLSPFPFSLFPFPFLISTPFFIFIL